MRDCPEAATWNHTSPHQSGFYEVRPCALAWDFGPHSPYTPPGPRLTYVDVATGRFDAAAFGGSLSDAVWEWRGPIRVPDGV